MVKRPVSIQIHVQCRGCAKHIMDTEHTYTTVCVYNGLMSKARNQKDPNAPKRVIGYVRVSTDEQADSGAGLTAQRRAIEAECQRQGWTLVEVAEDAGYSAKTLKRPALQRVLDTLRAGKADVLMAAKVDRLSRSTRDVCELGDMAAFYGFDLSFLDARIDTTTPHGRAQLSMMAIFAQLERELISQRTIEALAVKKSQGVNLGRPVTTTDCTAVKIALMREDGLTIRAIADRLNEERVPTSQGGSKWHPTSVARVLRREVVAA